MLLSKWRIEFQTHLWIISIHYCSALTTLWSRYYHFTDEELRCGGEIICMSLCSEQEPCVTVHFKGHHNSKALCKCELSLLSSALVLSLFAFPAFSQFTHASWGDRRKHNSKKRRESNKIKRLPRDLSNGFHRPYLSSSPGWPFPDWDPGPTTCYFRAWEKWWHNLVLVFCLTEGMALSSFILENSLQCRKKSCHTEKESLST